MESPNRLKKRTQKTLALTPSGQGFAAAVVVFLLVSVQRLPAQFGGTDPVSEAVPAAASLDRVVEVPADVREKFQLDMFYRKAVLVDGFPVVSSNKVSDAASLEAAHLIRQMLGTRPDLLKALVEARVRFSVMATDELTTEIPEHSDLTPADYWNRRARGLGATRRRPAVSCGEENLLRLKGDPYDAESILVHEFAHAIHGMALRRVEPDFDERLRSLYKSAMDAGLWKDKYAATNPQEYWAECVQSYFGTNRPPDASHNEVDNRGELKEYDRGIFELIDATFRKNAWLYTRPEKRSDQAHLRSFDRAQMPAFRWPANLKKPSDR